MEIDSDVIKARDMELLSKKAYEKLEHILHEINKKFIRMDDDVSNKNKEVYEKCTKYIIEKMKEVNPAFKDLFQEVKYTGSFYERSRVKAANEFDINLVLRKKIFDLSINEDEAYPGYIRLYVNNQVTPSTKDQYKWIQNNFLNTDSVNRWLEGILSRVFENAGASGSWITVEDKYYVKILSKSGPALTLRMQHVNATKKDELIDVDFVPVFEFEYPTWPKNVRPIPSSCGKKKKWYATPKKEFDPLDWRPSFAEIEGEIINNKATLKNVYRLMKGMRDNSTNLGHIKSYHIKTIFLWKAEQLDCSVWTKALGRVFMMFLFELENCLELQKILFFWDRRFNMIGRSRPELVKDMHGLIANIRKKINNLIDTENTNRLTDYMLSLYGNKTIQQEELQPEPILLLASLKLTAKNQNLDFTSDSTPLIREHQERTPLIRKDQQFEKSHNNECCVIL